MFHNRVYRTKTFWNHIRLPFSFLTSTWFNAKLIKNRVATSQLLHLSVWHGFPPRCTSRSYFRRFRTSTTGNSICITQAHVNDVACAYSRTNVNERTLRLSRLYAAPIWGDIFRALYSLPRISDNTVYLNSVTWKRRHCLQTEEILILIENIWHRYQKGRYFEKKCWKTYFCNWS